MAKISKLTILMLILLTVCAVSRPVEAETSIYVFSPDQSEVVKTGGFAGVHETYAVGGQFQLAIDSDSGVATFEIVDANLTDETGSEYGRSLDEIFNMTVLTGTIIDDTTIEFEGKTADGTESDVRLKLSLSDDSAHITGNTTPPPNSADMFFYDVNTVATKKYAGGTGEPNNPFQIATAADLILLGETPEDYDKHFILTADIDLDPNLSGRMVFDKAFIAPAVYMDSPWGGGYSGIFFTGVFDGNGHAISNLTVEGGAYLGLFGRLQSPGEVKNVVLLDVNITGSDDYVGGLAGSSSGTVTGCYSTGLVTGTSFVGGIVGTNYGDLSGCYNTGAISGAERVGGLVGYNVGSSREDASVDRCYSTGTVSGTGDRVGGLVGDNGGSRGLFL